MARYTELVQRESVQRVFSTIVLLCFAIGPGLNLSCLARCAPMSAAESPATDCHRPADSDLQVTSSVDCAEHQAAQTPALIVGRTPGASLPLFGPVAHVLPLPRLPLSPLHSTSSVLTAGPPPPLSAIPLRI